MPFIPDRPPFRFLDLTGMRFERLVVIAPDSARDHKKRVRWLCRCDCGRERIVLGSRLRQGHTKSCGCIRSENATNMKKLSPGEIERRLTQPRLCSRCVRTLPPESFEGIPGKTPVRHVCKQCRYEDTKASRKRNGRREFLKNYDISSEEYDAWIERQNGKCAICGIDPTGQRQGFCIDHSHDLPKKDRRSWRGLLCTRCNTAIGFMRDDPDQLRAAAKYLESYQKKRLDFKMNRM